MDKTEKIRRINDEFRRSFAGGRVVMTAGVATLPMFVRNQALARTRAFDDFNADNDPHGEHDFGRFEIDGNVFYWKIDYYDENIQYGSEDPADPARTTRVLTIMLAHEY